MVVIVLVDIPNSNITLHQPIILLHTMVTKTLMLGKGCYKEYQQPFNWGFEQAIID